MTTIVFTVGYEGSDIGSFIDTLIEAGVSHVIDVRDVPASRKRGFSKNVLSENLEGHGIAYTHLKALGDPKPGREAMRIGDYKGFLEIYNEHVTQPAGQRSLLEAVAIATKEPAVLLCYERNPKYCHRTLVASMMHDITPIVVRHLGVNEKPCSGLRGKHGAIAEPIHSLR